MTIFKTSKKQPIKFRGFKFIGFHKDYPNACYYYKALERGNYEIMECMLEGVKKPELGAGTSVKILDPFMTEYLEHFSDSKKKVKSTVVVTATVDKYFYDLEKEAKEEMIKKFDSSVPKEVGSTKTFQKYRNEGYSVLYCSNDESPERLFGIVNLVFVKEEHIKSTNKALNIDRKYTLFKPFRFSVSPAYLKGTAKQKYIETELNEIRIDHDLLV